MNGIDQELETGCDRSLMDNREIAEVVRYLEAVKAVAANGLPSGSGSFADASPLRSKRYAQLERILLPRDCRAPEADTLEAVSRPACSDEKGLGLTELAELLFFSAGRSEAGGAPVEIYLVTTEIPGVEAGVYHFDREDSCLTRLRSGDYRPELAGSAGDNQAIAAAPVTFACSALFSHAAREYGARAYRHCLWGSGGVLADLLAVAAAEDLPASAELGFVDAKVNHLLGLDGASEGGLLLVPVGRCLEWAGHAVTREVPRLKHAVLPLPGGDIDDAAVRRIHAASCLISDDEIRPWRGSRVRAQYQRQSARVPLGVHSGPPASLPEALRSRDLVRRFLGAKVGFSELSAVLDCAMQGLAGDFMDGPETSLIDLFLLVNSVDSLAPGAYRYAAAGRALEFLRAGSLHEEADRLRLHADLAGAACSGIFFLADLDSVLGRFGNRGYRAALVEAGAVAEKMRLIASSLGLGVLPLHPDENVVEELFSPYASGRASLGALALGRAR